MKLYSFGSNGSSQLGLKHNEDISDPTPCAFRQNTENVDGSSSIGWPEIRTIVGGGNHTFIQLSDGLVKAVGETTDGRCGSIPPQISEYSLKFIVGFQNCIQNVILCAVSWEASAVLVRNGAHYLMLTTGTGRKGELGQGPGISGSTVWTSICNPTTSWGDADAYPIDLAAGTNHFVAVLSNGDVYGWGQGRHGQLGEPRENSWKPRKIQVPFKAVRAVCGREFTYILGEPDSGHHIVLGSDKNDLISAAPATAPLWKQVGASWSSILILDQPGKLHTWGKPTRITPPENLPVLEQVAIGSEHVLAKTVEGKVIAWGWGKHGNCGLPIDGDFGDVQGRYNEIPIQGAVKLLGAGCATSWIGTDE
jgi:protein ATS1